MDDDQEHRDIKSGTAPDTAPVGADGPSTEPPAAPPQGEPLGTLEAAAAQGGDRFAGFKWYAHIPDEGIVECDTADEARDTAEAACDYDEYCDGGWPEDMGVVEWGLLVPFAEVEEFDRKPAPEGSECDYCVNYRLKSVDGLARLVATPTAPRGPASDADAQRWRDLVGMLADRDMVVTEPEQVSEAMEQITAALISNSEARRALERATPPHGGAEPDPWLPWGREVVALCAKAENRIRDDFDPEGTLGRQKEDTSMLTAEEVREHLRGWSFGNLSARREALTRHRDLERERSQPALETTSEPAEVRTIGSMVQVKAGRCRIVFAKAAAEQTLARMQEIIAPHAPHGVDAGPGDAGAFWEALEDVAAFPGAPGMSAVHTIGCSSGGTPAPGGPAPTAGAAEAPADSPGPSAR